jgi:uracil-DNA glycosylase family 4
MATSSGTVRSGERQAEPGAPEPPHECSLCPRLTTFRAENRRAAPDWHNAPVASFGPDTSRFLIVGLAPGLRGANRTGRPFTGDYAGDLLYRSLLTHGFATGSYGAAPDDGLELSDCMITNAVRCVPPENKPTPLEISTCRRFLAARIAALPNLRIIMALGRIAHESTLAALGCRLREFPFKHGARHRLATRLALYDSFHCSRYNTNTGRLTPAMFQSVIDAIRSELAAH